MDELKETTFPFPIADTESGPDIHYSRDVLTLMFVDYRGFASSFTGFTRDDKNEFPR